jgi:hypothetical protein
MATQPDPDATFTWRKSSASANGGDCVEVAQSESSVLVRNSKDQSGPILRFGRAEWLWFIWRVKNVKASGAR